MIRTALAMLALAIAATPADAGLFRKRRPVAYPSPVVYTPPALYPYPAPVLASPSSPPSPLAWLNAVRQARGLRPLAHDPALDADAQLNSSHGFAHTTRGWRRGQVVGWGDLAAVEAAWLADPPHAAILLDPYATAAGFGMVGAVSTIDTN